MIIYYYLSKMRTNPDYCVKKIRSKKFWSQIL